MRGINKYGQDPRDEKDVGKHDAALDELRRLKEALSNAKDPKELERLLSSYVNIASAIPLEFIPLELSSDFIATLHADKLVALTDPRQDLMQQTKEQGLKNDEKSARELFEDAMKEIDDLNKKFDTFLARDDMRTLDEKMNNLSSLSTEEKKEQAEVFEVKLDYMHKDLQERLEHRKKVERRYAKEIQEAKAQHNGDEKHPAVAKICKTRDEHLNDIDKATQVLKEQFQKDSERIKGDSEFEGMFSEKARRAQDELQNMFDGLNDAPEMLQIENKAIDKDDRDKAITSDKTIRDAEKLAARLTGGGEVKKFGKISPEATPHSLNARSRGRE